MKVIQNDNCIFFDCDDTLVMWDNKYKTETNTKRFTCYEMAYDLVPHEQNIQFLKDCVTKDTKKVVVWSAGGWEWAQEVVRVLRLEFYVDAVMSKPAAYVDDLHCSEWMGVLHYKEFKND